MNVELNSLCPLSSETLILFRHLCDLTLTSLASEVARSSQGSSVSLPAPTLRRRHPWALLTDRLRGVQGRAQSRTMLTSLG